MPVTRTSARTTIDPGEASYDADEDPADLYGMNAVLRQLEDFEVQLRADRARADALVLARESNEHNGVLMDGMVASSTGTFHDLPGAALVREHGMTLLRGGAAPPGLDVRHVKEGKARAVVIRVDATYWVLSMYSAAKTNSRGLNDMTQLLCKLVVELRPRRLCAVAFSRFVRSFQHGADLFSQVIRHVDVVEAGDMKMHMRGDKTQVGPMMWNTMVMASSAEREAILRRLTAGLVNKYRNDLWVLNRNCIPPGHALDARGRLQRVDAMQPVVQRMLELLADHDLPAWRMVKELATTKIDGHMIVSPKMARVGGSLEDQRASSLVRRWTFWLPVLQAGVFVHQVNNPFPGATRFSDMDVLGMTEDQPGKLVFPYEFGVPRGGWAPDEILTAAAARRGTRESGTGAKHRRSPLVGMSWQDAGQQFTLQTNRSQQYEIRATLLEPGTT